MMMYVIKYKSLCLLILSRMCERLDFNNIKKDMQASLAKILMIFKK